MMAPPLQSSPHAQRGFGLIEVLVALTILSVGMLGLAAMQLTSLQSARESLNTTIATIMVRDMNERAWAQQDMGCSTLLQNWRDDVDSSTVLPSSKASSNVISNAEDPGASESYRLAITWPGRRQSADEDDERVSLAASLPCKQGGNG